MPLLLSRRDTPEVLSSPLSSRLLLSFLLSSLHSSLLSPLLSSLPSPLLLSLLSPLLHHYCHHCCHHCHSQEHQLHRHCFNTWFNGLLSLASVEDEATPPVYVFGVDLDSGEEIVLFLHATYISDGLKQNKRKPGFKLEVQRTLSQPYMWHLLH